MTNMVKKLQKRFIIVIMSIFAIVIIGVFTALYISMTASAKRASMMTLRKIADFGGINDRPVLDFKTGAVGEIKPPNQNQSGHISDRAESGEDQSGSISNETADTETSAASQVSTPLKEAPPENQPGADNSSSPPQNDRAPGDDSNRKDANDISDIYEGIDTITVKYNQTGKIFEVVSLIDTGTDVDSLNETVLSGIISAGKTDGTISIGEISYRYYNAGRDYGGILVMAPRTAELDVQKRLIIMSLTFGMLGMIIMLLISIGLSKWISKPIAEAWQKQQRFVADASHELKTPLTVISASLDIISSNGSKTVDSQKKWIENIKSEAGRMRQLITDLLTLAKMDSAKETKTKNGTSLSRISLSDTVFDTCLSFESVAFESGKQLDSDGVENDIFINGDEKAIHRLTAILLDNAVKNSDSGGIITVTLKKLKNDAILTCSNTGQGIPEEAIGKIFERFYRADDSRSRETGGFGLGLAIAKAIVNEHGGKISVESVPDKLTSFTVKFPLSE